MDLDQPLHTGYLLQRENCACLVWSGLGSLAVRECVRGGVKVGARVERRQWHDNRRRNSCWGKGKSWRGRETGGSLAWSRTEVRCSSELDGIARKCELNRLQGQRA